VVPDIPRHIGSASTASRASSASDDRRVNRRGTLLNYLTAALQGGVFLFHVLAARVFGAAAYGTYRWAWSVIEIALQLGLWGLNHAVMRGVASAGAHHDAAERRRTVGTAAGAVLIWSGLIGIVLGVAPELARVAARLPPGGGPALRWLAPMVIAWSAMMVLITATMATRSMSANLAVRGVTYPIALIAALGVLAIVWRGGGARALGLAMDCAGIAALVAAAILYRRTFNELPPIEWRPARWDPRVLAFALPVGASEVVNQTLTRIDMVLLGLLRGNPRELAVYGAAMLLVEAISGLRYAMDPLLSALVAATHASGDRPRLQHNLRDMISRVSLIACPVAIWLMVWGDVLLRLWGDEYTIAFTALGLLALAHFVNATLGLHQWVVVMSGHPTLDLINNIVALAAASLACAVAIPRLGLPGAALGALTAIGTLRGLQLVESWWLEGVHGLSWQWARVIAAGLVSAAAQVAIRVFWGHGPAPLLVGSALGVVLYLAIKPSVAPVSADAGVPASPTARTPAP
jgi:O-antigen/teichoic acid export membrane protein